MPPSNVLTDPNRKVVPREKRRGQSSLQPRAMLAGCASALNMDFFHTGREEVQGGSYPATPRQDNPSAASNACILLHSCTGKGISAQHHILRAHGFRDAGTGLSICACLLMLWGHARIMSFVYLADNRVCVCMQRCFGDLQNSVFLISYVFEFCKCKETMPREVNLRFRDEIRKILHSCVTILHSTLTTSRRMLASLQMCNSRYIAWQTCDR